jgi:hypothetical protein
MNDKKSLLLKGGRDFLDWLYHQASGDALHQGAGQIILSASDAGLSPEKFTLNLKSII